MNSSLKKLIIDFAKCFLVFLIIVSCERSVNEKETPDCIWKLIDKIRRDPVREPPAQIWQYTYNNMTVYYFPPYCCDIQGVLVDENCNYVCAPDGGIGGAGDGKCTDFFRNRTNGKLIWKDERAK